MSIVREFERAFNRQDVAALVACFSPDGSYHDTFFGGHSGPDGLRGMFERMFREGRDYRWTMETVVETDAGAAAEWASAAAGLQPGGDGQDHPAPSALRCRPTSCGGSSSSCPRWSAPRS